MLSVAQGIPIAVSQPPALVHHARKNHAKQKRQKQLTEAQEIALAERAYQNVWNKASGAYGAEGMPAPAAEYKPGPTIHEGAEATTRPGETGITPKKVELAHKMIKALAGKPSQAKREAKKTLLHEWAHIYQTPAVFEDEGLDPERAANMLAEYYGKNLLGINPAEKHWTKLKAFQELIAKYGPGYWKRGQFGENYGKNPQEIY